MSHQSMHFGMFIFPEDRPIRCYRCRFTRIVGPGRLPHFIAPIRRTGGPLSPVPTKCQGFPQRCGQTKPVTARLEQMPEQREREVSDAIKQLADLCQPEEAQARIKPSRVRVAVSTLQALQGPPPRRVAICREAQSGLTKAAIDAGLEANFITPGVSRALPPEP